MKILLINNTFGNFGGGSEKVSYETGKILREKSFEVFFFSSNKKPYYEKDYIYNIFFPSEPNKYNLYGLFRMFYNFEAEKKLTRLLKIIKPDVVHINNIAHNLTVSVLVACKKNNVPVVMTLHDSHFACPTGILIKGKKGYCTKMSCANGNILPCITNKCYSNNFLKSSIAALEFWFRKRGGFYNIPDAFICPSNYLYNLAVKSGIRKDKLSVINNFASPEYLLNKPEYSNQNYFLYAGRLVKEKGLEHLLEAFSRMPEIKLKIAGEGVNKKALEKLAGKLNLSNVEFLGLKTLSELELLYKNSIATILPSVCSEVFGLTIVESFVFGKPVIASNIGGIPEVISDNYNGFLVSPGNAEEIKQAVLKLYNNNPLAVEMGINARKTIEERFTTEIYFEKLVTIYSTFLKNIRNLKSKLILQKK